MILQVSLLAYFLNCQQQQSCKYEESTDETGQLVYSCTIHHTNVLNETQGMMTYTNRFQCLDEDVEMFIYKTGNNLSYIPNSIFETFSCLKYFEIHSDQGLEVLKPEYLKNARSLESFSVIDNDIKQLDANLFEEAPNLVSINLEANKIVIVHKKAFSGLFKLESIYLQGNNIKFLHPTTFSHLTSLLELDLTSNGCINKMYNFWPSRFYVVETETLQFCPYDFYMNFFNVKRNIDQSSTTSLTAERVSNQMDNIDELRAEKTYLQEEIVTLNDKLKTLRAVLDQNKIEYSTPDDK